MKKLFLGILIAASIVSCDKKETKSGNAEKSSDSAENISKDLKVEKIPENCYLQVVGNDSMFVQLTDNLGTFTGNMAIKNAEKDSSKGELSGFKNGDTLKLSYSFESEGKISDRPVYFLVKDGSLIEGFGDFTNPKTLKYDDKNKFNKTDCENFEKNFK